jgi:putative methionine-R-sulfoxide reductase with GAF domain
METTGSYLTVLQSLTRIQESLDVSNSIHSALHLILDELVALLKPETALIGLLNQNNQKIEIQVSFGLEDSTTPIPIKQSIVGWSAFHNRSVHLGNFGNARFTPIKSTSSSAIAIPMIIEGKVIGIVNLEH